MRVLIVGGGVAGLTLASLLIQQGRRPTVVEKAPEYVEIGYGIGLYPLGSCVFHGLGLYDEFLARGTPSDTYQLVDGKGRELSKSDMSSFTADLGPVMMISRTDLIDLLRTSAQQADLRMGTTVTQISQTDSAPTVSVGLSDGTSAEYDLVVAADGIHSETRSQVFGEVPLTDTGWTCLTWWADGVVWPTEIVEESWGPSAFFGIYPTDDKVMAAAVMPNDDVPADLRDTAGVKGFLQDKYAQLLSADGRIAAMITAAESFFPWPMADVRAPEWVKGRVVLCGDSGAGFLPTAGVGASNALRSAAALADELSRVGPESVPLGLDLFVKRAQKTIEKNQHDSRTAAKYMFVSGKAEAWGRDQVVKHYPAEKVISSIVDSMKEPF